MPTAKKHHKPQDGRDTVFVLGAGATRGASFVPTSDTRCLPPLDADFFTHLQRVANPKHQRLVTQVITDTVDLFGVNFGVTLETAFTTLEHTIKMISATRETGEFRIRELRQKRENLLQALAAVMEESLNQSGSLSPRECTHHRDLVTSILKPRDTIISFNYDCLIDHSLKKNGEGKWNPRYGYGFPLGARGSRLTGDAKWRPDQPADVDHTVQLYKLHGSLHFFVEGSNLRLKQRPYTKQRGLLHFDIIPPESHKPYDKEPFRGLWRKAGTAIHRAKALVLIGYSMPPTDLHSTALFRTSVKKTALHSLVIVNPDRDARKRIRDVVQRGLGETTRVLVFDTLAEFVATPRNLWDRT